MRTLPARAATAPPSGGRIPPAAQPWAPAHSPSFLAVQCTDSVTPSAADVDAALPGEQAAHPLFGASAALNTAMCVDWPAVDPDRYLGPWNAPLAAPALIVNSRYDPATPLLDARATAAALSAARVLVVEGIGHTTLDVPSRCATDTFDRLPARPHPAARRGRDLSGRRRDVRLTAQGLQPHREGAGVGAAPPHVAVRADRDDLARRRRVDRRRLVTGPDRDRRHARDRRRGGVHGEHGPLGPPPAQEQRVVAEGRVRGAVAGARARAVAGVGREGAAAVGEVELGRVADLRGAARPHRPSRELAGEPEDAGGDREPFGGVGVEQRGIGAARTAASFQPRFTASPMPVFMPWAPAGEWTCAASPARNTRPTR